MNASETVLIDTIRSTLLSSWGFTYIVLGSVGTMFNLIVFTRPNLWSLSPCMPYFFASALSTIPLIWVAILSRVGIGMKITPFYYISSLCKLQVYISNVSASLVIWFMIGSCWDRYISSSRDNSVRRWSSMRNTYRVICLISFSICILYAQIFYCFEGGMFAAAAPCSAKNAPCSIIDTTLLFFIQFILPPLLICYFGRKIFLNIRQLNRPMEITNTCSTRQTDTRKHREVNRTVLHMLSIHVLLLIICSFPLFAFRLYSTITSSYMKSSTRRSMENLIFNITLMIFYFEKLCSFYIYTLISRPFRKILWQAIISIRRRRTVAPQS